jgi:hypothetical protein
MSDQEEIEQRLSPSRKLFEVIVAKRTWHKDWDIDSGTPTDNLDLVLPKGWSFGWERNGTGATKVRNEVL